MSFKFDNTMILWSNINCADKAVYHSSHKRKSFQSIFFHGGEPLAKKFYLSTLQNVIYIYMIMPI